MNEHPKWKHRQKMAPKNLIESLSILKKAIESVIEEEEERVLKYQEILKDLGKIDNGK